MARYRKWPYEHLFLDPVKVAEALSERTGADIAGHNVRYWFHAYPVKYPDRPQPPAPVVLVTYGMPARAGSPRWEPGQMQDWENWYRATPHEAFTAGNQHARQRWGPVTEEQQAGFRRVLAAAQREGRAPSLAEVREATGLGYMRARQMITEAGFPPAAPDADEAALVARVRAIIAGEPGVTASQIGKRLGTRWDRTLRLVEAAGGIPARLVDAADPRWEPRPEDGRVPVRQVTEVCPVSASMLSRMVSRGELKAADPVRDRGQVWFRPGPLVEFFNARELAKPGVRPPEPAGTPDP